ncbi:hypothetical protein, partial [Lactobacillus crispatus]|uniref:hypothetical protein n=1 Tax=Lactobacillus crispatus TaxID=47770 RepID=UPI0010ED635F
WSKDQFSLFKNKNRQKKTVKQLKLRVGLIVFQYLRVSFFPDTYFEKLLMITKSGVFLIWFLYFAMLNISSLMRRDAHK